jgi:hypothetical protein
MKSSGRHISGSRYELMERLATVMQASQTIRSEVALSICESSEMRIASRQLRLESSRTTWRSEASRQGLTRKPRKYQHLADAIVQVLSRRGYSAFVAGRPQDTATIQ